MNSNKVLIRLYVVEKGIEYNVLFDSSFSLDENLSVLSSIVDYDFKDYLVYDYKLNLFINKDIPLSKFNFPSSRTLYLY